MRSLFLASLFCLSMLPVAATAQQYPVQGAPVQANGQPCGQRQRVTPPEQAIYNRAMRRLAAAQLTPQQQQQIQQMVQQFSQANPAGSPLNRQAMQQLRRNIMGLLSPQQLQAVEQAQEQMRAQREQNGQMQPHNGCRPM